MARGYPDYEGGKSKTFTVAEWAAFEGTDRNFYDVANNVVPGGVVVEAYVVPAGVTLVITQFSFMSNAAAIDDRDNNQMCEGIITDSVDGNLVRIGGNGGGSENFAKPLEILAGRAVTFWAVNNANHNCNLTVCAQAYEY